MSQENNNNQVLSRDIFNNITGHSNPFYIMPRVQIINNYISEVIINNTGDDDAHLQSIINQEIPALLIEGNSIIINDALKEEDLYGEYDSNNFVIPEVCQNCNWVCCNGECVNELPTSKTITKISDDEPEEETNPEVNQ